MPNVMEWARRARQLLAAPIGEALPVPDGAAILSDQEAQVTVPSPAGHSWRGKGSDVDAIERARRARQLLEAHIGEALPLPDCAVKVSDQEVQVTAPVPVGHSWLAKDPTSVPWSGLAVPANSWRLPSARSC